MYQLLFNQNFNQWLSAVDIKHLQDNTEVNTKGIIKALLPAAVNSCLLSGCQVTQNGTNYDVTAGYFYHDGFIFEVDAHSIDTVNIPYWSVSYSFLASDPVPVDDGNGTMNVHKVGKAELVINSNQAGVIAEFDQLYYLHEYMRNMAEPGSMQMLTDTADLDLYDADGAGIGYNAGWQLLDGRNGYPDLSGAFAMGESAANLAALAVSGTNSKTITEQNLPAHSHGAGTLKMPDHTHGAYVEAAGTVLGLGFSAGNQNNQLNQTQGVTDHANNSQLSGSTGNAGGGQALDITPKHFKVLYRLRVA